MSKLPSETGTLAISAADEASEIFLIDASLRRIASGLGKLEREVPLGVYKVRFRSGASQEDRLVEVAELGARVTVESPPVWFRTAAPIDETLTTHEYQQAPASATSLSVHVDAGRGGELFLFVREEDDSQPFAVPGVTIHALDSTELAQLDAGESIDDDRWAGINVRLDPGTYSVRVASGQLGEYEMFATVSQGWQTQVFLVMEDFWKEHEHVRAPSLRSASMLMAHQGQGFQPTSRTVRLAELARQALSQGRNVISSELMNELLHDKFMDPMLGIIAAHLLRRRHRPDRDLLRVVTGNLLGMLGEHPDLQALLVATKDRSHPPIEVVERPPSLRSSWADIVRASRRRATLVPPDSPVGRIAQEVVAGGPWLIHRLGKQERSILSEKPSMAEAMRVVEQLASLDADRFTEVVRQTESGEETLSGLERSVLSATMSHARVRELHSAKEAKSARARARQIVGDLSAPSYSIANAVISLANKMDLR